MKGALIIGKRYKRLLEKPLEELGIEVLWLRDNPYIDWRLAGHADLSAVRLGKKIVVSRHISEDPILVKKITNMGYELVPAVREQNAVYPNDAGLCACVAGGRLIHNLRCTDPAVSANFRGEKIHVNQGYAKCSCCILDGSSLISSDEGILDAVSRISMDVLKIKFGGILLDGFDYGFIGGAAMVLDDAVLLTGELADAHDKRSLEAFIKSHGKQPVYLRHGTACDIGGAVVL